MQTAAATLSLKTSQDYQSLLEKHSVQFKLHTHAKATTMEEAKAVLVLDKAPYIKNLLFKLKKGGYVLVVALDSTKISKHFWKEQGIGHNNVRIAEEKDLEEILNCKRGCVNPLSLANDTAKKVLNLFVDNQLKDFDYCMFHPGDNEATLEFKRTDFESLMGHLQREIQYVDLEVEEKDTKDAEEEKDADTDENKLKITVTKAENFSEWYRQIITKAEMIEYYNVSGCYILRPTSYFIWEQIQTFLDTRFKQLKVRNTYFPMFVTKEQLETEKEHVKGFAPEVAWVTKGGDSDLAQPIAIRPTSETIMYPAFAKWVRSHRDLPVLVNQWTNVVRWEFKSPTPFIRVREFLWQEGHTAHATQEEANTFALEILDRYVSCYKDLLALPVVPGRKSENEKFAGGDITYTLENFSTTNGRSIQACTSHLLGQNFAKMFNIAFQGKDMEKHHAWQTSWGFSIRSIGAYLLTHADDKGLVLTPSIAEYQVVLIPITFKGSTEKTLEYTERIFKELTEAGIRVYLDDRTNYNPGFKINEWELKGIPVRLEIGPKDIEAGEVKLVRRFDGAKKQVKAEGLAQSLEQEFKQIHQEMYAKAEANLKTAQVTASNFKEFMTHLNQKKMILTPWCDDSKCELNVKEVSGNLSKVSEQEGDLSGSAKTLCKPLKQDEMTNGTKCFNHEHCGNEAKVYCYWGRSY